MIGMGRNLYRRISYARKRKSKALSRFLSIATVFAILALLVSYVQKRVIPYLVEISEFRAKSIITMTVYNAVSECFTEEIHYDDLVTLERNEDGVITSIKTNVSAMNSLSAQISTNIQKRLIALESESIVIPFGVLLGDTIFTGVGPDLHIKITPYGNVATDFMSEVIPISEDQTKHKLYLQVKTSIAVLIPLIPQRTEIVTNIPVAESVIRGKIDEECFLQLNGKIKI